MSTLAIDPSGNLETIPDIPGLSIKSPLLAWAPVTQAFGVVSVTGIRHRGIDQGIPTGTPVHTILPGTVVSTYPYGRDMPGLESDGSPGGYGSQVHISHNIPGVGQFFSHYGHLQTIYVASGQPLLDRHLIALSDDTGISTGPHLHWEIRLADDATRFDPAPYIDAVIPQPDPWEAFMVTLTPEQQAALMYLADHKGALSPYILAAEGVGFTAANDAPGPADPVSRGIRGLKAAMGRWMK